MSRAREIARTLSLGAVLTLNEAAEALPMADSEARAFLRREGLVSDLDGRPVVVWLAVVERLRQPGGTRPPRRGAQPPGGACTSNHSDFVKA